MVVRTPVNSHSSRSVVPVDKAKKKVVELTNFDCFCHCLMRSMCLSHDVVNTPQGSAAEPPMPSCTNERQHSRPLRQGRRPHHRGAVELPVEGDRTLPKLDESEPEIFVGSRHRGELTVAIVACCVHRNAMLVNDNFSPIHAPHVPTLARRAVQTQTIVHTIA